MTHKCAIEQPVELYVNEKKLTTFMCTPSDLEVLAIGHLLVRGYVDSLLQIQSVSVDEKNTQIHVTAEKAESGERFSVPEFILSGYSGVSGFSDNIYKLPGVQGTFSAPMADIVRLSKHLAVEAPIYRETGGVHGAAILYEGKTLVKEDIGRHNAVDKCIGEAMGMGVDFSRCVIATTGRISLDMLLKTASMGIPVVASFKYPSNLGVQLAEFYKTTLIGRATTDTPLVYTCPERVR